MAVTPTQRATYKYGLPNEVLRVRRKHIAGDKQSCGEKTRRGCSQEPVERRAHAGGLRHAVLYQQTLTQASQHL